MSFLDIFTPSTINTTVNALVDSGDALVYTDEEKAQSHQQLLNTKITMLSHFEPFKVAQRYIAFAFTINFIVAFWVGVALVMFTQKETYEAFMAVVVSFSLGWIMLSIVSFYFSGGFISSFKNTFKKA